MDHQGYKNYGSTTPASIPLPVYYITPTPPPRRSKFRFMNACLGAALLLWLTHHLFHRHWHHHRHDFPDWEWDISVDGKGIDHGAEGCAVWDHYDPETGHSFALNSTSLSTPASHNKYAAVQDKYTFSISTSSERYHFVSWGPIDKSSFEIVPVESDKDQLVVEVDVLKDLYDEARVCALGGEDVYGVGIYSPRREHPYPSQDWPAFRIKLFLPVSKTQSRLNALETRLGQFEHIVPDLSSVNFSRVVVGAANVPMSFKNVVADTISASNANGKISGEFVGGTQVVIKNANAPIEGEVTLTGAGKIVLSNANSPITSKIHLKSGDFHPRPDYNLDLSNANAPISATIASQPLNSGLFLKANTALSNIDVRLNESYEGGFKLSNVFGTPVVDVVHKKDPSGADRERYVKFDKRGSTTSGSVQWGDGEHAPGQVDLSTVGGSIRLSL